MLVDVLLWEDSECSLWSLCLPPEVISCLWIRRVLWEITCEIMPEVRSRWEGKVQPIESPRDATSFHIAFLSGTVDFINVWSAALESPCVYWVQTGRIRRPCELPGAAALVSHSSVGGVSTHRAWMGITRASTDVRLSPTVSRVVRNIIKFSEQPEQACETPSWRDTNEYQRISLTDLDSPIHYATHMTRSKWGSRLLLASERRQVLDIPDWIQNVAPVFRAGVPLKILMAVSLAALRLVNGQTPSTGVELAGLTSTRATVEHAMATSPEDVWLEDLGRWMPGTWASGVTVATKACKADDAEMQLSPWRLRVELVLGIDMPQTHWLRMDRFIARVYRRTLCRSFMRYLRFTYGADFQTTLVASSTKTSQDRPRKRQKRGNRRGAGDLPTQDDLVKDIVCGLRVIGQNLLSTTWDWDSGSALIFWRWADLEQRRAARDGMPPFMASALPTTLGESRPRINKDVHDRVYTKLKKVIGRRYLEVGPVRHLLHYFQVPKGESDIRMVYDGTKGGFNDALWAPSFYLPDLIASTWFLDYRSWMYDLDLGECFLNFPMPEAMRLFSGISLRSFGKELRRDFPHLMPDDKPYPPWMRWSRLFMGSKFSPFAAVRHILWMEEMARGDPADRANPFHFDTIKLNLPGMPDYDPSRPKMVKWDSLKDWAAAEQITFMDDGRGAASSADLAWRARDWMAKTIQHKGCQDAVRKAGLPSKAPQAWIGGVVKVTQKGICVTLPLEKWQKLKRILSHYREEMNSQPGGAVRLAYKKLEKDLGFLCHAAMTLRDLRPFLRGFYLTMNSWRPSFEAYKEDNLGCPSGWADADWEDSIASLAEHSSNALQEMKFEEGRPKEGYVIASPRLFSDLEALEHLTRKDTPTEKCLRHQRGRVLIYGFTDASGTGGGASFERQVKEKNLSYRVSVWEANERAESSNWREFTKLVEALEEEAQDGGLRDSVVFMFTDNATTEAAIQSGRSSSPRLHALVVRFLALQTLWDCTVEVYHVAGTRMIAQGTDGISRGSLNEGIMDAQPMLSFVPLHLTALERADLLEGWLRSWLPAPSFLNNRDWFEKGHGIGGYQKNFEGTTVPTFLPPSVLVWTPQPYAADIAIAELRKSRHKRMQHMHVFVCPRLCADHGSSEERLECTQWLGKCEVCAKETRWTRDLFCANFAWTVCGFGICRSTWCPGCYTTKPSPKFHVAGQAEGLAAGDEDRMDSGWRSRKDEERKYMVARKGDHLMTLFECDRCVFWKLYSREADPASSKDQLAQACIRRVLLDAFWSRASSTVEGQARAVASCVAMEESLGLPRTVFVAPGPMPPGDTCGYQLAVLSVWHSLGSGKYSASHRQWDTVRRVRTTYGNQVRSSAVANSSHLAMSDQTGKDYKRLTNEPCASLWLARWSEGCKKRMGQDWRPDRAISVELMRAVLSTVEEKVASAEEEKDILDWIRAGVYFVICFVLSLRGNEGLLLDVGGLLEFAGESERYVVFPLLGQVKGEHHTRQHKLIAARRTRSGIEVAEWHQRMVSILEVQGRQSGPVFVDGNGKQATCRYMNRLFHEAMVEVWNTSPGVFPPDIKEESDVTEKYDVYRSFRRGSESRAIEQKVATDDQYVVNRWQKKERAQGRRPAHPISQHYCDVSLATGSFLRYTEAM